MQAVILWQLVGWFKPFLTLPSAHFRAQHLVELLEAMAFSGHLLKSYENSVFAQVPDQISNSDTDWLPEVSFYCRAISFCGSRATSFLSTLKENLEKLCTIIIVFRSIARHCWCQTTTTFHNSSWRIVF